MTSGMGVEIGATPQPAVALMFTVLVDEASLLNDIVTGSVTVT